MTTRAFADRTDLPGPAASLLRAVLTISGDLDLRSVLTHIVEAATELTGARYGALGVVGGDGELSEFVTTGLTASDQARIGPAPRGLGILGLLIDDPEPIRLEDLSTHPAAVGMPPEHPRMRTFLGVPIRIRGTVFGNLYLTEKRDGSPFTDLDETLVLGLANAAGLVIENARTYGISERRRLWLEASAQVAEAMHPPVSTDRALHLIVTTARAVAGASAGAIVQLIDGEHPVISASASDTDADLSPVVRRLIDKVRVADHEAIVIDVDLGGAFARVVPLRSHVADPGALVLVFERSVTAADDDERDLVAAFTEQAGMALDRAEAFADREELAVVSERGRIARDLHDVVIQRLFAAGLKLQSLRMRVDPGNEERFEDVVTDLDQTIKDIRTTIFGLQQHAPDSLRAEVLDLVDDYEAVLGFRPTLRTYGLIDLLVPEDVGAHLLAVLREALSNAARHAHADDVRVEVRVEPDHVLLEVRDNGMGIPADRVESGLRNARERAAMVAGRLEVVPEPNGGTTLRWSSPLGGQAREAG